MPRNQIMKHMMPRDIPLFAAYYRTEEGQAYDAWEFDVFVGDPDEPGAFYPNSTRRQAMYLNSLKIDAVGWFYSTPTLIECKPNAGCSAIGQVLVYQKWYSLIFDRTPSMMIVCQRMPKQIRTMCDIMGIAYRVMSPAQDFVVYEVERDIQSKIEKRSVLPLYRAVS